MKKQPLYIAWFALFLVCAVLGSVKPGNGVMKAVQVALAICFFIPPGLLLYDGLRRKDRQSVLLLRLASGISLGLTFLLMVLNFLSAPLSQGTGQMLYALLVIFSAPMVCSQYWAASIFAWACILVTTVLYCPRKK